MNDKKAIRFTEKRPRMGQRIAFNGYLHWKMGVVSSVQCVREFGLRYWIVSFHDSIDTSFYERDYWYSFGTDKRNT